MALTTPGSKHIPFRNSKLTLILKESLGGNSKTTLLCTGSRQKRHSEESIQTLYFASRAKAIKNNCKSNVQLGVKELQHIVYNMKKEILTLRGQLKKGGLNFNPILDSKLLSIIKNDEWELDGEEVIGSVIEENPRGKRASLIHLTEQEIVMKYCELRAKYDNLLETAGNKIYQLSNQPKTNEFDHNLINDIKNETDQKLQEIVQEKNDQIQNINEQLESYKILLDSKDDDYNQKIQELSKENLIREEENTNIKSELSFIRDALNAANSEIEKLREKINNKKKKSAVSKEEKKNVKRELENYINLNQELNRRLNESETKNLEFKQKFEEISHKYGLLQIEVENLSSLLKQKGETEDFQKIKIKELQDQINNNIEQISNTEKKYSDLFNRFSELEFKFKSDTEALTSKDLYNQTQIELLKNENENLNNIIKDKISGQEIFAEKEKILSTVKSNLEKRIEELLAENEKIKNDNSELFSRFNTEKSDLTLQIDNLNREIKSKAGELENMQYELENVKKIFEEKLKSECQKVEQLNSRMESTDRQRNELESVNLILTESEKKFYQEKILLEKELIEKSVALEEQKELTLKYLSHNEKLEKEIKELREALAESQNKNREDTENEKKYLAEIVSIKNDLDFKAKKISDTDKKVEEIKQEKKILQDSNQKMSDVKFYFLIFKIENQTIRG